VEDIVRGIVIATGAALNAAQRSLQAYGGALESLVGRWLDGLVQEQALLQLAP
jgi:hypothetical protein